MIVESNPSVCLVGENDKSKAVPASCGKQHWLFHFRSKYRKLFVDLHLIKLFVIIFCKKIVYLRPLSSVNCRFAWTAKGAL